MFSVTMIEPEDTGNPCVSVGYYGKTLDDFQEQKLLSEYKNILKRIGTAAHGRHLLSIKIYGTL